MIFEMYVNERIGARAIGVRLNERGLRTKAGKPFNAEAVLTVLRNRVYLGEVYFRGTWYRADNHHSPLVDADLFEQAQQILIARSGLLTCGFPDLIPLDAGIAPWEVARAERLDGGKVRNVAAFEADGQSAQGHPEGSDIRIAIKRVTGASA